MRSRKEEVLDILTKSHNKFTAKELADKLQIDRANVSRYLNELTKLGTDGIRLDEGFDGSKEAMLSYNPEGLACIWKISCHMKLMNPLFMGVITSIRKKVQPCRMISLSVAVNVSSAMGSKQQLL